MERIVVDTNIILRYLVKENEYLYNIAESIIKNQNLLITNNVFAQVLFVLNTYYKSTKDKIKFSLEFISNLSNIEVESRDINLNALRIYTSTTLEFVDCWLLSYCMVNNLELITFDKKLNNYRKRYKL